MKTEIARLANMRPITSPCFKFCDYSLPEFRKGKLSYAIFRICGIVAKQY